MPPYDSHLRCGQALPQLSVPPKPASPACRLLGAVTCDAADSPRPQQRWRPTKQDEEPGLSSAGAARALPARGSPCLSCRTAPPTGALPANRGARAARGRGPGAGDCQAAQGYSDAVERGGARAAGWASGVRHAAGRRRLPGRGRGQAGGGQHADAQVSLHSAAPRDEPLPRGSQQPQALPGRGGGEVGAPLPCPARQQR